MTPKLGRLPRAFDPRIPHLSALLQANRFPMRTAETYPDWLVHIADLNSLGMMENDRYGCCAEAGAYHALQVLSSVMNPDGLEITEPDLCVLKLYEEVTGFNPADAAATDNGTVLQDLLKQWVGAGIPSGLHVESRHRCVGFAEVDPRNHQDVLDVIEQCGFIYLGFNVPNYIMGPGGAAPLPTWDAPSMGDDTTSAGGHCVIGVAAMPPAENIPCPGVRVISWGAVFQMTWPFWDQNVDECYAVVDRDWGNAKGSPFGIPLATLAKQMEALAPPPAGG